MIPFLNNVPLFAALAPSFQPHHLDFATAPGWFAHNPSVVLADGQLWAVLRTVNFIHYQTHRVQPTTRNFLLMLRPDLSIRSRRELVLAEDLPILYWGNVGLEDLRPFAWRGDLWASGCTGMFNADGRPEHVLVRIGAEVSPDWQMLSDLRVLRPPGDPRPEKNWMPQVSGARLRFLYWHVPTTMLDETGLLVSKHRVAPNGFRGSTQLIPFDGGWLGVVHETLDRPNERRYYFHRFVWLDAEDRLRAMGPLFRLCDRHVDYVAGLCWHPDGERLVISFAVCDVEAWLGTVSASGVRAVLNPTV